MFSQAQTGTKYVLRLIVFRISIAAQPATATLPYANLGRLGPPSKPNHYIHTLSRRRRAHALL